MTTSIRRRALLAVALALGTTTGTVYAQAYPSRPIHIVVPAVPGGAADFTARYVADRLGQSLGQPVLVENRAGGSGNIGADFVAKAAPDGYTIAYPITSFPTNPSLIQKMPFDTVKDFDAIVMVAKAPLLLVVNPKVPVNSVGELVQYAKNNPGKVNFAHSGSGTTSRMAGELFKKLAGINIVPVGYKGGGQITTDLIGGHVQMYFSTIPAAIENVKAGNLRVLAVTSTTRAPGLPDVPTMIESGVPDFSVEGWFGLFAPAGTPKPVVAKLNQEVVRILALPETQKEFGKQGVIAGGGTPEDLRAFLLSEIGKWKKIITEAGIKAE